MIFTLLIAYQVKHLVCDYFLQGRYMLGKFKAYPDYVLPLMAHVGVHGAATFAIASFVKPEIAFDLAVLDAATHFAIDRIKASPDLLGRFKALSGKEMKQKLSDYLSYVEDGKAHFPRAKSLKKEFRQNTFFWWSLGADQMCHHLVHYGIIWYLVT